MFFAFIFRPAYNGHLCYLQKIAAAKDYYQRKVEFLTQQMEKIQPLLQEKYQMKEGLLVLEVTLR
jgi:prefoldin subunit 5